MFHPVAQLSLAAILTLSGAGLVANTNAAASDFSCGVAARTNGGMLAVEGTLLSPTALVGEYRFALKSNSGGGSTNISQGGQFSAAPNAQISLGQAMVNAGAHISVDFIITANGKTFDCSTLASNT